MFIAVTALMVASAAARASESLSQPAAWEPPSAEAVRASVFEWLEERQADEATRAKASELWPAEGVAPKDADLLTRLARTIALVDEDARKLVDLCSKGRTDLTPSSQPWLLHAKSEPFLRANLRLLYGRWLVGESLFDEAREQLDGLRPEDVVDPAALLFYQGVVRHRLLDKEAGMEAIEQLLRGAEQSPRRYAAVARLMEADLKRLEVDSLDHIARRMDDVHRRLDLGRAGPKVRKIEDGVIESLDKLIKELERQQQQSGAPGSQSLQPTRPAEESRLVGGKGRGEVTKKDVGSQSGWGDLPPKQREEALQQIGREFPLHYRDVIEQYFRKLASEGSE
jgi:hypothetical protein